MSTEPLLLYNTLSREIETLRPIDGHTIRFYACGPTIYNFGHIGNFRTYVAVDLLRRTLKASEMAVKHVMQFTDVDDKTIREAQKANLSLGDYTGKFRQAFIDDANALHLEPAEHQPNATDHIPEMIELIAQLVASGHAYPLEGSVYFRLASFPRYGCLCHLDLAGLEHGHRIAADEYEKEGVGDFVLWKAWQSNDGPVAWESPWGRGRPGWHIECSALANRFLGPEIDLHAGGVDLRFPHHENEIAQSESAFGKDFVRHWFHVEHLLVEGQKMSKSAGNFYTVRDVLEKGYSGRELRYALYSGAHYRKNLNFSWQAMEDARAALQRLDEWRTRLKDTLTNGPDSTPSDAATAAEASELAPSFRKSLQNDLNVSDGLAHIFQAVRNTHRSIDEKQLSKTGAQAFLEAWANIDQILGLGERTISIPAEVAQLVEERKIARAQKDFKKSDELRMRLLDLGWKVKDGPKGQELMPSSG